MEYTLADGTTVYEDTSGNVTAYSPSTGGTWAPDQSVLNGFLGSILGGVNSAIATNQATKIAEQNRQTLMVQAQLALQQSRPLILLGLAAVAGLVIFKAIK